MSDPHRRQLAKAHQTRLGMLRAVTRLPRRKDEALARYYAYRCAVWKALAPPGADKWDDLALLLRVARPVLTDLKKGGNGSRERMPSFARALGPLSLDDFEKLARAWADTYPAWKPGDPLPVPLGFTGDPLIDGAEMGGEMFSENLRIATRALPGLMQCTAAEARDAARAAWHADPNPHHDWIVWLIALRGRVDSMRRAPASPAQHP